LEFDEYLIKGGAAIGKRLSTRTVKRISELTVKIAEQQEDTEVERKETKVKELPPATPKHGVKDAIKVNEVSPATPKQKSKVANVKEMPPATPKQKSKAAKKKSVIAKKTPDDKKKKKSQLGLFDLKKKD
jgi:hypothetical protein